MQNGATGVIQAATAFWPGYSERSEIHGTKGTAVITGDKLTTWDVQDDSGDPAPLAKDVASGASDPMAISLEPFERQFLDFGEACKTGRKPSVSGEEGYRALEVVVSAYESCRRGEKDHTGVKDVYYRTSSGFQRQSRPGLRCPWAGALGIHLECRFRRSEILRITVSGRDCDTIPTTDENLIWQTARRRWRAMSGRRCPPVELQIHNDIPLGKGLGSSAAALTAGVVIADQSAGSALEEACESSMRPRGLKDIQTMSPRVSSGSIVTSAIDSGGVARAVRLELHEKYDVAIIVPDFTLPTSQGQVRLAGLLFQARCDFQCATSGASRSSPRNRDNFRLSNGARRSNASTLSCRFGSRAGGGPAGYARRACSDAR